MTLLEVSDLHVRTRSTTLVRDLALNLEPGERVGLIGESGSGKSLTALAIMGLLPENLHATGSVTLEGMGNLLQLNDRILRTVRGKRIAMVFQEPMSALDPLMKVGKQIAEVRRTHGLAATATTVGDMLRDVDLPESMANSYPHELSGGQRQRVLIAMALACDPDILLCDEPTTALDVTVQKHIVKLILRLADQAKAALLFITHDLGLVASTCERLLVMRNGEVVETGTTSEVLDTPQHDYTRMLVRAADLSEPRYVDIEANGDVLLEARGISRVRRGTTTLAETSLALHQHQRLGIVGGSGSGKTTLLKILAGLDNPTTGSVVRSPGTSLHMVFQDPQSSLNPRMRVGRSIAEPLHGMSAAQQQARVAEVLQEVDLEPDAATRFPHEFSGGQRQRISIARAIAAKPSVLLADEPVSALDMSVRTQVMDLLDRLVRTHGLSLVFVSHDLAVVRQLCTDLIVLRNGEVVERGNVADIYNCPQHDYTRQLLEAALPLQVS
ncbi:ABC transporter ATP-binding protein [Corynebacterium sp.]|uniref:ATP-binding cassette domain-containing protein n=1 Tax=Corynebacterium sp. TaxID=1720 RepID=UPI0026DD051C|nr:ABC transporter ATP-binding protein [Corynebacterium sp.]MDO5076074.1 ABC transporter ATP-binding protein [Corynebacterium sp.]